MVDLWFKNLDVPECIIYGCGLLGSSFVVSKNLRDEYEGHNEQK